MIYHILSVEDWQNQAPGQPYRGDTLDTEGFIHCTGEVEWLLRVANRFYRASPANFVILCIDPACVQATVQWEAADQHIFPHIYGPLNLDAVVNVVQFPRAVTGQFLMPTELCKA